MSSLQKIILLLIISPLFVHCTEGELTTPPTPTTTTITTTSSTTTTTMTYGACEKSEDTRFNVQICERPDKCHIRDIGDGYCRPSCGYLAVLVEDGKYAHYGPKEYDPADDPHFLSDVPCEELDKWGATDWKRLPLVNGLEPWEVALAQKEGRVLPECCGSDQQVAKNNGEYEETEQNNDDEQENTGYEGDDSIYELEDINI